MSIKTANPTFVLQPYIKQYWCIENVLPDGEKHLQRIIPSGLAELSLYIGNRPKVIGSKKDFENNFILSGQQQEFYDLQIEKDLSVFSIVFQPQGLMTFFHFPLIELCNKSVPLKYLNRNLEQEILPRITNEPSFEKRIQIIERYFCDLLKEEHNKYNFARIDHTIKTIRQTQGKISINNLASETCLCRKQFERKFSELIGITPKKYLKIVRFQSALYLKSRNKNLNITELAYELGYYDQAHFISEFKRLTGFTPKQYFDQNTAYSDFFE